MKAASVIFLFFIFSTFSFTSITFSMEVFCGDKNYQITQDKILVYVSIHCLYCKKYVEDLNRVQLNLSKELPWLIFKENNQEQISRYMQKNALKNLACITNKKIQKMLKTNVTPQIIEIK